MSRFLDINGNPKTTIIRCTCADNVPPDREKVTRYAGKFEIECEYPYQHEWKVYVRLKLADGPSPTSDYAVDMRSSYYNMKRDGEYLTAKITKFHKSRLKSMFYFYIHDGAGQIQQQFDIDFIFEPAN